MFQTVFVVWLLLWPQRIKAYDRRSLHSFAIEQLTVNNLLEQKHLNWNHSDSPFHLIVKYPWKPEIIEEKIRTRHSNIDWKVRKCHPLILKIWNGIFCHYRWIEAILMKQKKNGSSTILWWPKNLEVAHVARP